MSVKVGGQYRVYLQDRDGQLMEIDAIAASVEINYPMIDVTEWHDAPAQFIQGQPTVDINLRGIGPATFSATRDHKYDNAAEWACGWCGRPNKRARETCQSCGAVRPFVYS